MLLYAVHNLRLKPCAVLLSKVQEWGDSSSSHEGGGGQMPKVLHGLKITACVTWRRGNACDQDDVAS
jgi:hypothetical protein